MLSLWGSRRHYLNFLLGNLFFEANSFCKKCVYVPYKSFKYELKIKIFYFFQKLTLNFCEKIWFSFVVSFLSYFSGLTKNVDTLIFWFIFLNIFVSLYHYFNIILYFHTLLTIIYFLGNLATVFFLVVFWIAMADF